MTNTLIVERIANILILRINRPEVHNAIDAATCLAIDAALHEAERDDAIGAVILTGTGDKTFCAGMDLKFAAREGVEHVMIPGRGFCGVTERHDFAKPLICAANGSAYAGGFEMLLACDIVIANDSARFALPEIKRGLFAGAGGIVRMAQQVPRAAALGLILTGEPITAERAFQLGLVTALAPAGQVLEQAINTARIILAAAPRSVIASKRLFNQAAHVSVAQGFELSRATGAELMQGQDRMEGVKAFAEGRAAEWKDR